MKKVLGMALLALALGAGLANAEKSETPTLDRLRALINDPRFKGITASGGQTEVFQAVLESLVPELKELNIFYRQCLAIKLRIWIEKNKSGIPDGHAIGESCLPDKDVLMKKYGSNER